MEGGSNFTCSTILVVEIDVRFEVEILKYSKFIKFPVLFFSGICVFDTEEKQKIYNGGSYKIYCFVYLW